MLTQNVRAFQRHTNIVSDRNNRRKFKKPRKELVCSGRDENVVICKYFYVCGHPSLKYFNIFRCLLYCPMFVILYVTTSASDLVEVSLTWNWLAGLRRWACNCLHVLSVSKRNWHRARALAKAPAIPAWIQSEKPWNKKRMWTAPSGRKTQPRQKILKRWKKQTAAMQRCLREV